MCIFLQNLPTLNILDPIFYRTLFYDFRQWSPRARNEREFGQAFGTAWKSTRNEGDAYKNWTAVQCMYLTLDFPQLRTQSQAPQCTGSLAPNPNASEL
jgi:hypothetical protein